MDPFGRPTHQHHHRDDDDDYRPSNQPPPPYFDAPEPPRPHFPPADPYSRPAPPQPHFLGDPYSRPAPPPPQPHSANVHHTSHSPGGPPDYYDRPPPPQQPHPPSYGANYASDPYDRPPPPPTQQVTHVSHEPHHHRPHMPSIVHGHPHNKLSELENKPSVRVYSKAEPNYSLAIRDGQVILVRSNPSDPYQQWIKDEKNSIRVKDEQGFPSFSLVNKATGQAIKHSIGATYPVQLTPYNPDVLDESVLWTESVDLGDSYRTIRMVNNIRLNFDAFDGNKNRGGVHDGTTIVLWEWGKGENQRWKIVPY